jgi:hypothetical protein
MPVSFTDDNEGHLDALLARIIEDDDDSTKNGGENHSDLGSVSTASEYGGNAKDAPEWMLFENLECRAIFEMAQDKNKFQRVYGRHMGTCTRSGHGVTAKAKVGLQDGSSGQEVCGRNRVHISCRRRKVPEVGR